MTTTLLQQAFHLGDRMPMDRWLRFAPPIQALYDAEVATRRVRQLQSAILVGLALYNVYNITSMVLLPDMLVLSMILRLAVVTPSSLALFWLIQRTRPAQTEILVTGAVFGAFLVPVYLFWATRNPFGLFTFGEFPLTILFANMLLTLRFRNAVVFTSGALCVSLLAVATKSGLDPSLRFAFAMQITTACVFALYANHAWERRRCLDYLAALKAKLRAENADADRQVFHDLSRTDPLTRLPNRRHLTERLETWLAERRDLTVMMIDIDHFKLYNDALGHPAGDACLQDVSDVFARIAAQTDGAFCARFGGEEFTFAVPNVDEAEAERLAGALVRGVTDLRIPHPARGDGVDVVSISAGLVRCAAGVPGSLADLLTAADRALYRAKRQGRNGFVWAEKPSPAAPADGHLVALRGPSGDLPARKCPLSVGAA